MKFMPPSVGLPVTFRQFSWQMLCAKEWGAQFRAPDHGIYLFDSGRRFDSTDQYKTGVYGSVPYVVAPILSAFPRADGVELEWEPAFISGTTIQAYELYRSYDGVNYSRLAVLQGSAEGYFDAATVQSIANVVDASGNQYIDSGGDSIVFIITAGGGSAFYYLLAESATNALSAPSNVVQAGPL